MKIYRHSPYYLKTVSYHIVFNIIPIYPKVHYTTVLLLFTSINKYILLTIMLHIVVSSILKLHFIIIVTSKFHIIAHYVVLLLCFWLIGPIRVNKLIAS